MNNNNLTMDLEFRHQLRWTMMIMTMTIMN